MDQLAKPNCAGLKLTSAGELLAASIERGAEIVSGKRGTIFEGLCGDIPVCLKTYRARLLHSFGNPAHNEFLNLRLARSENPEILDHMQVGLAWLRDKTLGFVLISKLVTNYDGTVSRNLIQEENLSRSFVVALSRVLNTFVKNARLYNPVAPNVLVQHLSSTESQPVLVDFVNYENYWHYPMMRAEHVLLSGRKIARTARWVENTLQLCEGKVSGSPSGEPMSASHSLAWSGSLKDGTLPLAK